MLKIFKSLFYAISMPVLLVVGYLIAALIGGLVPGSQVSQAFDGNEDRVTIYLTGTLLHTDIAIPVSDEVRERYAFLGKTDFPLEHPNLEYLVFGWGSEAFYTETANYSDITFLNAWKAATGDSAVLHIGPAANLSASTEAHAVSLTQTQFRKLLDFMDGYFQRTESDPDWMVGESFGYGDVFYRAKGNFNLLNPCNVWVSEALRSAGLKSGIWTPTSYSLFLSQRLHN